MKTYTIRKGRHFSLHMPRIYLGIKKNFILTVLFDDSCKYWFRNDIDQYDINKLWGISFGFHQDNSIRIGWRYDVDTSKVEIWGYIYQSGDIIKDFITSVPLNEWVHIDLDLHKNQYAIYVDRYTKNECFISRAYHFHKFQLKYFLFPYFGGNKTAPHDINIKMDVS